MNEPLFCSDNNNVFLILVLKLEKKNHLIDPKNIIKMKVF